MNLNDFTIQRNMIVDDFPNRFRYHFGHLFLMTFGIDLASFGTPLVSNSMFFSERLF